MLSSCTASPPVRLVIVAPSPVVPPAEESTPHPTPTQGAAITPTAAPALPPAPAVRGFLIPIEGACLPSLPTLWPGAPRPYRWGVHEGIDFYPGHSCVPVEKGTPVRAAASGTVIRADHLYKPLTSQELEALLARVAAQGYSDPQALDRFRGRQVWIDHGGGIVTRYCHLDAIPPGLRVGQQVEAGQVIGYIGNTGTPEEVTAPNTEFHLHFEIRVGEGYLGQGLPPEEAISLYMRAFSP